MELSRSFHLAFKELSRSLHAAFRTIPDRYQFLRTLHAPRCPPFFPHAALRSAQPAALRDVVLRHARNADPLVVVVRPLDFTADEVVDDEVIARVRPEERLRLLRFLPPVDFDPSSLAR